jgi:hypothetical protein
MPERSVPVRAWNGVHGDTALNSRVDSKVAAIPRFNLSARRNTQGVSLLLVEDHEDPAEAMSRLLRDKGYAVQTCGTVAEALKLASEQQLACF